MLLIYKDMSLGAIIEDNLTLIPVLDRFGISLGLADRTVEQVCAEHSIDIGFFLTVLNTFLNEDYFPEREFAAFHAGQITDYLRKTNDYFRRFHLPNIQRHLGAFTASGAGENPSLSLIAGMFAEAEQTLSDRMDADEKDFFPRIEALCGNFPDCTGQRMFFKSGDDLPHEGCELLHDIKSVMVRHLTGRYDRNLCYAVLFAVSALEHDVRQHDRIRYRILGPMADAMEKAGN